MLILTFSNLKYNTSFVNSSKKLKAVFGEWLKDFYSCDFYSYEQFIHANKKNLKNSQSLFKFQTENQSFLNNQKIPHQVAQSSTNLNGELQNNIASKVHRCKSNFPISDSLDEEIDMPTFLKETGQQIYHPVLKDLTNLWTVYPQPPYEEEVTFFVIF